MQMQLAQVMETATPTVGLPQQASSKAGTEFEASLESALKSGEETPVVAGEESLVATKANAKTQKKTSASSATETEQLASSGSGSVLYQFLVKLNQAGLSTADIKHLLAGESSQVSDAGLKSLLSTLGYNDDQISSIMADSTRKEKVAASLCSKISDLLDQQAEASGQTGAALKTEILTALENPDDQQLSTVSALSTDGTMPQLSEEDCLNEIIQSVATVLNEQPASLPQLAVAQSLNSKFSTDTLVSNSKELSAKADKLINTATEDLGIDSDQLAKVLTSTDPEERATAVSAVTEQVKTFLEANQGEPLAPEVKASLQFIKAGMSDSEFSKIDDALKAFSGISIKSISTPMSSQVMQTVTQQLTSQNDQQQMFNNVLDQFKQSFASELKTPPSSVSLELNPPMLGRVDVNVSLVDGNLSASFKTDQVVTRDMLTNNLENLKETLREQGFNVNQVNVSMDFGRERRDDLAFAFAQQQWRDSQQQTSSRNAGREQSRIGVDSDESYNTFTPSVSYAPGQLNIFA